MKSSLDIQIKIDELKLVYATKWSNKKLSFVEMLAKSMDRTPDKIGALQWVLDIEKENDELLKEKQLYEQQIAEAQKRILKINELIKKNAL